jgi:peptidoglycan/xylan/chitin deacetylase (PgdA/CDA1 family)
VIGPPSRVVARRQQRRRLRNRRLGALGGVVGVVAVLVVILSDGGGGAARNGSAGGVRAAARGSQHANHRGYGNGAGRSAFGAQELKGNRTVRQLAKLGLPIYCGGAHGNEVAFTFDDGPGPYTGLALKKLRQAGERATFFVVGRSVDQFPGYLPLELRLAAIGDHTYTHPELTALAPPQVYSQVELTAQKIAANTGVHADLFRPPYGLHNATVDRIAQRLGMLEVLWNVDSADSLGADYLQITRNVEAGLRPGAIVLMHENRGQTIRALTALLPELHRRHLRSVSVPELLASDPPSLSQLRAGPAGCRASGAARAGSGG